MFRVDTDWEKLRFPEAMRTFEFTVTTNSMDHWSDNNNFYTLAIDLPIEERDHRAVTNHNIWQLFHVAEDDTYPAWQKGGDPVGRQEEEPDSY